MILLTLFFTFFKIGLFTFGGGYAMLPLIEKEVLAHEWLAMEQLIDFIAVSESTPGPFAINMATYIGVSQAGVAGAALATLGVILPSFIVILIVARFYYRFKNNRYVEGCMSGLRPTVVGLIGAAFVSLALTVFFPNGLDLSSVLTGQFLFSAVIFAAASVAAVKKVHPILLIALSALLGIGAGYLGLFG